jgi:hypothetical protein
MSDSRFAQAYQKYLEDSQKGIPANVVADAIAEAITSPYPNLRYVLAYDREKARRPNQAIHTPYRLFYSQVARRLT